MNASPNELLKKIDQTLQKIEQSKAEWNEQNQKRKILRECRCL